MRRGGGKGDVTIPPWQHDFNVLVADWAARAGFADAAKFRDRLLVFTIGRFTSAPDFSPQTGTGYWWLIARDDQQYLTWKALYDANYPDVPRGRFVTREDFEANKAYKTAGGQWDDYIGSYVSIARAAAAAGVRSGFPKAREAYDFVSRHSPQILKNESRMTCVRLRPKRRRRVQAIGIKRKKSFFQPREFAGQRPISVVADGRPLPAQVDVKRTFDDGSVKQAIVSMVLPRLDAAGLSLNYQAADSGPRKPVDVAGTAKRLLTTDFDATVTLTFPGGKSVAASARDMLQAADGKAKTWLCGPVAVEWLLTGPLVNSAGHADPDMAVQFQVRYYPESGHARVSVVVEKCSDQGADGGVVYDVVIQRGHARREIVFEQKDVRHCDLMRWRKVLSWGSGGSRRRSIRAWTWRP